MRGFIAFIQNLSAGLTIWPFLSPTLSAAIATAVAFWAASSNWGYLPLFLAALFTFATLIWSWIGVKQLFAGAKRVRLGINVQEHELSYNLFIGQVSAFQANIETPHHFQISFLIINNSQHAIQYRVRRTFIKLNDRVPPGEAPKSDCGVLRSHMNVIWKTEAFPKSSIEGPLNLTGILEIEIDYGHASTKFSKTLIYNVDLIVYPPQAVATVPIASFMTGLAFDSIPISTVVTKDLEIDYVDQEKR